MSHKDNPHRANIGPTRCGKTYQAINEAKSLGKPILFINPKAEDIPGFVRMDGHADGDTLVKAIKREIPVNYIPHRNSKIALKELDVVVQRIFTLGDVVVIFDEALVHGYQGLSASPLIDVAERGAGLGVEGFYLCQDPAGLSKRILRNCDQFRVFAFNEYSRPYFERLGYDVPSMQAQLLSAGKYSYIIMEGGVIKGIGRE